MADYAGALNAIEQHLVAHWLTTPVAFENDKPPDVKGPDGMLVPWVLCEVKTADTRIITLGGPGLRLVATAGFISLTLFVRRDTGRQLAREYACQLADIFRTVILYQVAPDQYVRTHMPVIGPGNPATSENPNGNWWAINIMTPFDFYHRA